MRRPPWPQGSRLTYLSLRLRLWPEPEPLAELGDEAVHRASLRRFRKPSWGVLQAHVARFTIPRVSSKLGYDERGRLIAVATTTNSAQTRGEVWIVLGNTSEVASTAPWRFLGRLPVPQPTTASSTAR
jgi:hypothetical protein